MLKTPFLLMVAGPTGAGKSNMTTYLSSKLGIHDNVVHVLVDDLVQADPIYVRKMRNLLRTTREGHMSQELQKKIDSLYYRIRDRYGCNANNHEEEIIVQSLPSKMRSMIEKAGCARDATIAIMCAIQRKANIVFETTGHSYQSWLISIAHETHHMVLAYAMTDFTTLLERNHGRVHTMIERFQKNGPAPRLPDLTPGVFEKRFSEVRMQMFRTVEMDCIGTDSCGGSVDRFIVIDTTGRLRVVIDINSRMTLAQKTASLVTLHKFIAKILSRSLIE